MPFCFFLFLCACLSSSVSWTWRTETNTAMPLSVASLEKRAANKSLYILAHSYQGETFFDEWDFITLPDPTNGAVQYQNRTVAFADRLAYVTPSGQAVMRVNNWTTLNVNGIANGTTLRPSVRIQTQRQYDQGLWLLDVAKAPWGCGAWPAFWSTGDNWPANGEIDIIEQVHKSLSDKISFHTETGCLLTSPGNYTGVASTTNCSFEYDANTACGIDSPSVASFGQVFDEKGGGVYAMMWDNLSISVWFFYRSAIPDDILGGLPDPETWPLPDAQLSGLACPINQYFHNHNIIFDITLCGDWAGSSYSVSGCPGTCNERVADPSNFVNATWVINYVKIYNQTIINTAYLNSAISNVEIGVLWYSIGGLIMALWLVDWL